MRHIWKSTQNEHNSRCLWIAIICRTDIILSSCGSGSNKSNINGIQNPVPVMLRSCLNASVCIDSEKTDLLKRQQFWWLFITFKLVFAESSRNGCTDSSSGKRAWSSKFILIIYLVVVYVACSALTLLVLWQKGDPTCKENRVVGCWCGCLSGARCRLAYGPADATATHCLLLQ